VYQLKPIPFSVSYCFRYAVFINIRFLKNETYLLLTHYLRDNVLSFWLSAVSTWTSVPPSYDQNPRQHCRDTICCTHPLTNVSEPDIIDLFALCTVKRFPCVHSLDITLCHWVCRYESVCLQTESSVLRCNYLCHVRICQPASLHASIFAFMSLTQHRSVDILCS